MASAKRILLTTIGSLGDLHPIIALGLELQRRGHHITIATTELYRQKITSTGFAFHPMRPDINHDNPEFMRKIMDLKTGPEFLFRNLMLPSIRDMYHDLDTAARNVDLAISAELVYAMPLVAEKRNLRWASVVLSPSSFFTPYDFSVIPPAPWTRHLYKAPLWTKKLLVAVGYTATKSWIEPVLELRRDLGLSTGAHPIFTDKFSPYLNLVLYSQSFAGPNPGWPKSSRQTSFVFYDKLQHHETLDPQLTQFLEAGAPPIIFTLGSAAVMDAGDFYEQSVEAAQLLGIRALLLTGQNAPAISLPQGIAAFPYAPYSQVFPKAACVVHQGGIGTTAQALRAGKPQLVVPFAYDQPDNAARLERIGVARSLLRARYTAATAASHLKQLISNPAYLLRAAAIGQQVSQEDGLSNACDALESLADLPLGLPPSTA